MTLHLSNYIWKYITYDKFRCEMISVPNRKFVTPKIFNDLISMDIRWIVEI